MIAHVVMMRGRIDPLRMIQEIEKSKERIEEIISSIDWMT